MSRERDLDILCRGCQQDCTLHVGNEGPTGENHPGNGSFVPLT